LFIYIGNQQILELQDPCWQVLATHPSYMHKVWTLGFYSKGWECLPGLHSQQWNTEDKEGVYI